MYINNFQALKLILYSKISTTSCPSCPRYSGFFKNDASRCVCEVDTTPDHILHWHDKPEYSAMNELTERDKYIRAFSKFRHKWIVATKNYFGDRDDPSLSPTEYTSSEEECSSSDSEAEGGTPKGDTSSSVSKTEG